MREIKFRGWSQGEWKMFNIDVLAISPVAWYSEGTGMSIPYQPQIKLMQFTGVTDRKGVEIYEGDILKLCLIDFAEVEEDIFLVRANKFHGDVCYLENIAEVASGSDTDFIEVIGNIFENPGMLEVPHEKR